MASQIYGRFHAIFRVYCLACKWQPETYGDHESADRAARWHEKLNPSGHISLVEARTPQAPEPRRGPRNKPAA